MENREIAKAGVSPENLELLKIALKTAELAEENILKFYHLPKRTSSSFTRMMLASNGRRIRLP